MTLDYKILWIDDREEFFTNHKDYISEHLEEKGFEANITTYESYSEFENKERDTSHQKKYDLFLIDLNLDHGKTGDAIINQIRENRILTDIIFYSTNLQDVRNKVNDNNIEGVFVASRNKDDFEEKVTDVIDMTIKKIQDVNNLRGLIMAEVAELDRIKERIIINYATKNKCGTLEKYLIETLKKSNEDNTKKVTKNTNSSINGIIKNIYVDSDKKARTIKKIEITFDEEDYRENILKTRNKFAHIEEKNNKIGDIEFTEENCIQIRKDIRKYKDLLNKIEQEFDE